MSTTVEAQRERFCHCLTSLGVPYAAAEERFHVIDTSYGEAYRHYHNLSHVWACIGVMQKYVPSNSPEIELALWFHDVIYDTKAHDNEERSADLFEKVAAPFLHTETIRKVRECILATKHNAAPTDKSAQYVVDVDLSILGEPTVIFDEYDRQIREEYIFVPNDVYCTGRSKILQGLLDREWVYSTPEFRRSFEGQARTNLKRTIARLAKGESISV